MVNGGGDKTGSRRMRRSFRLCVAGCVLFMSVLWLSERTLRYDLNESQFIIALTHETESARAILRHVVKRDAELKEFPTARYVAALAEREEDDLILPTYEQACKLDPTDSFLALRYGCRLFLQEKYADARSRFREAAVQQSKNSLPKYLEAVALSFANGENGDFSESLALIAKANAGADTVAFPQPLWSPSLPARGVWYERLRRQIQDECCAPLYKYADTVLGQAKRQINLKQVDKWDHWLETIQQMGERIAFSGEPGSIQATAGVRIQLGALEYREKISAFETGVPAAGLVERRARLESILDLLNQFEQNRDAAIAADSRRFVFPLKLLGATIAAILAAYCLSSLLGRVFGAKRTAWVLPHSRLGLGVMGGINGAFLVLLIAISLLQFYHKGPLDLEAGKILPVSPVFGGVRAMWFAILAFELAFGLAYPALQMNRASATLSPPPASRCVYASFFRRYFGIQFGLALCLISIWVIGYRVLTSLYPWQLEILTTGLGEEERGAIQLVMSLASLGT
jgi:hypothetical protein